MGFDIKSSTIFLTTLSILSGWPAIGTFTNPGKSTNVRSTKLVENILNIIGSSDIILFLPATRFVSFVISVVIVLKSVIFTPGLWRNSQ